MISAVFIVSSYKRLALIWMCACVYGGGEDRGRGGILPPHVGFPLVTPKR